MKSLFIALSTFSLFLLFASVTDARKDLGEYWKLVMKDQPMPKTIRGLIPADLSSDPTAECHTSENNDVKKENVEPRHDITIYVGDTKPREENIDSKLNPTLIHDNGVEPTEKKLFVKEYSEPMKPDLSIYDNGIKLMEKRSFIMDSEPMKPDLSIYDNGVKLMEKRSFIMDSELTNPDATIYDNSVKPTEKRSFIMDSEPMKPDASIYDNDVKPVEKSFFIMDSVPVKSDASIYDKGVKPAEKRIFIMDFGP